MREGNPRYACAMLIGRKVRLEQRLLGASLPDGRLVPALGWRMIFPDRPADTFGIML
jgi:hypothetical protein